MNQPPPAVVTPPKVIEPVRRWVERVVVGLNLCPFAQSELLKHRVRFAVSQAQDEPALLVDLQAELERLTADPGVETTLLIHPAVLTDFDDYNQFLDLAEALLRSLELDGIFQIASFHPDYQFAGTEPDDAENFTNRAPYPLLHLLREASLENAIDSYPGVEQIPQRNVELLTGRGREQMQALLAACING